LKNLLDRETELSKIVVDPSDELGLNAKLHLYFSSPVKEDVHNIEIEHEMKWPKMIIANSITLNVLYKY